MSYKLADGSLSTDYEEGDLFIYVDPRGVDHGTFRNGSVVELLTDDGTDCPLFGLVRGECFNDTNEHGIVETSYASWEKLTRYSRTSVAKEQDPDVSIKQSDYDSLVDEINMLRECVADMNKLLEEKLTEEAPTFKPISEMTMEDWKQAKKEGWVFETEARGSATVIDLCFKEEIVRLETSRGYWWVDSKGYDDDQSGYTVVKRIQ